MNITPKNSFFKRFLPVWRSHFAPTHRRIKNPDKVSVKRGSRIRVKAESARTTIKKLAPPTRSGTLFPNQLMQKAIAQKAPNTGQRCNIRVHPQHAVRNALLQKA